MADLLHILPSFPTGSYTHLLPSLERHFITTTDLITVDAIELAKRAQLPVPDVRNLANAVVAALKVDLGTQDQDDVCRRAEATSPDRQGVLLRRNGRELVESWSVISLLDEQLDAGLGGGIPTGYVTEITGESGAGKTQFLLTLLLAAQLPAPQGLQRPTLYISTEAPLSTTRLSQLLREHPRLAGLSPSEKPSLDAVLSITVPDLESQDHILRYQLPVTVRRHHVGLVVIDSVAANYRAEFEARAGGSATMARRSAELIRLGALLRDLARAEDVAVVVANQVADRFVSGRHAVTAAAATPAAATAIPNSSLLGPSTTMAFDVLTLDHQQRWFTGWGDDPYTETHAKTPSLGHTWTLQLSARIALLKEEAAAVLHEHHPEENTDEDASALTWRRRMKVVFAPWAGFDPHGVDFVVSAHGIKAARALPAPGFLKPETSH